MIIDFHTHTFPEKIAAITLEKLSRAGQVPPCTNGTAEGLLSSMRTAGIDLSVILPVATRPDQVPGINNSAAALNEQFGKQGLVSFGCIHPDCADWYGELCRVAELGLKGIKIHPVYQQTDQDDLRYLRILERCGELDLIVVTHGGIDLGIPERNHSSPEKFCGLCSRQDR